MKQKFIILITLLLALACAAVPAVADSSSSAPLLPMQFFGTASYENGDAVPAGFSIVAELSGETFTYTLSEGGLIGSDGVWGEKFLVDGDTAGETITFTLVDTSGDTISTVETVTYNPGETYEIALIFGNSGDGVIVPPILTPSEFMPADAEIKTNTVAETNAATKAEVGYQISPTNISEMKAPTISRGSLSVMLNDAVKVIKKLADGSEVEVEATVNEDGSISVTGSLDGAESVTVNFIGRQFGDGTGDNKVDLSDAISALRITAEIDNPTNTEQFYMDVSADSVINLDDSILLLRYAAELVDENYVNKA